MGKAPSETKKKKKGRPSLLDIQKRLLKQQKLQDSLRQNPPPNDPHFDTRPPNPSRRNSSRRTPNPDGAYPASDWVSGGGEDDDDERLEKKHRLLLGLDSQGPSFPANTPSALPSASSFGADSNASFDDHEAAINWRRISGGSDYPSEKLSKVTDTRNGSQVESGPTTPLPDKKLLVFILDRLQKKDTYGVFSEPVDPEELPDYHDIIKHPMDFGTVRKKLDGGAYANLEQFEADIFLICSNAMEYNAPDTVFFRQARAMQDIAKKDFENLRQDSDSEPEQPKVVRRGRPPGSGRGLKKLPEKPPVDYVSTDVSSDANPSNGDNSCWLKTYNLRREPPVPDPGPSDSIGNGIHRTSYADSQANWFADLENEFPASVWKAVLKNGKKLHPSEENKRDTYRSQSSSGHDQPVLSIVEGEVKHLAAVGAHLNHGYARSLARFAANLGPIVWNIASKKIASVLPCGIDFGPGWVGEKERMEQQQLGRLKTYTSSEYPCKVPPIATAGSSVIDEGGCSHQSGQDMETFRRLNSQAKLLSSCDSADVKSLNHSRASCFPNEIRSGVQAMPTLRS